MLKLYLDCDGVILDSITTTYELLGKEKIDTTDYNNVKKFYEELDWNYVLEITPILNDSINAIKNIIASNLYDVEILTHVNSLHEAEVKIKWFNEVLPGINVIPTKKEIAKCDMVDPKGAILVDDFLGNLDLWHKKGGISIKYSDTDKPCRYLKVKNLNEILDLTLEIEKKLNKTRLR